MTSPKQARDTDNGRYYTHPVTGEQLVSITNVLDSLSKPALVPAAVKITAEKAADMVPQLMASALVQQCKPKRVADECGRCTPWLCPPEAFSVGGASAQRGGVLPAEVVTLTP